MGGQRNWIGPFQHHEHPSLLSAATSEIRATTSYRGFPSRGIAVTLRRKSMKRSLRALLLLVGLLGTFAYAAVPKAPAPDGPMPLCWPPKPSCNN